MITNKEFKEYSKGRSEMSIIEFDNFEKFKTPIKPKNFVTVACKYIYKNELEMIKNNITQFNLLYYFTSNYYIDLLSNYLILTSFKS